MVAARQSRTGDIVRWTAEHVIEYLGRSDFQVKVRGFRIELGEIDTTLVADPDVRFAVTVAYRGPAGDTLLASYVVPAPERALDTETITRRLTSRLPAHMVPSSITVLDEIPLNAVGKFDRKALPAPEFDVGTREYRAPADPVQETVAEVFAEVLGLDRVSADAGFFDLGGNSLSATRAVARLRAALDTDIGVRALFEAPTVEAFAARIEHAGAGPSGRPALTAGDRPDRIPLSYAQQRMWFINQFDTSSPAYNIPMVVRLTGDLDVDALTAAVTDVVTRHESLRTRFPLRDGEPVQEILSPTGHQGCGRSEQAPMLAPTAVVDEDLLREELTRLVSAGFDVAAAVPLRVGRHHGRARTAAQGLEDGQRLH